MLPTGDIQGGLRKLETVLRTIKYTGNVNYSGLSNGDPAAFLPLVSYALTSFSPVVAEQLVAAGLELSGKTDLRFTETVYKVLRDIFQYKPILTKEQFLQLGFSQRKIAVVCDIINLVLQKHNQNKKSKQPKAKFPAAHKTVKVETISFADLENAVSARPIVVNHLENPSTIPVTSFHKETIYSQPVTHINAVQVERHAYDSPEHDIMELIGEKEEETAVNQCCVEIKGRLSALETQIEGLVSGMDRIRVLEHRLEELENMKSKDTNEGQLIEVPRVTWENLLSRVLLLETKLELSSAKENVPPQHPPSSPPMSSNVSLALQSGVKGPASKENDQQEALTLTETDNQIELKERLERITHMLKSTSSLLKNTDC